MRFLGSLSAMKETRMGMTIMPMARAVAMMPMPELPMPNSIEISESEN